MRPQSTRMATNPVPNHAKCGPAGRPVSADLKLPTLWAPSAGRLFRLGVPGPEMQARPSALRRERPRGGPTCVLTRVRGIWKWSIRHVPQTVVLNGPNQARKSAKNGPSSTHGPPCVLDGPESKPVAHPSRGRNRVLNRLTWRIDEMTDAPGHQARPAVPHRPLEHVKAPEDTQGTGPGEVPGPDPCGAT